MTVSSLTINHIPHIWFSYSIIVLEIPTMYNSNTVVKFYKTDATFWQKAASHLKKIRWIFAENL